MALATDVAKLFSKQDKEKITQLKQNHLASMKTSTYVTPPLISPMITTRV